MHEKTLYVYVYVCMYTYVCEFVYIVHKCVEHVHIEKFLFIHIYMHI